MTSVVVDTDVDAVDESSPQLEGTFYNPFGSISSLSFKYIFYIGSIAKFSVFQLTVPKFNLLHQMQLLFDLFFQL